MKIKLASKEDVIAASSLFKTEELLPSEKLVLAKAIQKAATQLGAEVDSQITKAASYNLQRPMENIQKSLEERKEYIEAKKVDKLLEKVANKVKAIDKIKIIEEFDVANGLDRLWGKFIADPISTVLDIKENEEKKVKIASAEIPVSVIEQKKDHLAKYFVKSFVDKLLEDPNEAISFLKPQTQELLYSLING